MVVRWDIAEEHLQEAAFLHARWENALRSPSFTLDEIANGPERRMLAHLDALLLGGAEVEQELLLPALRDDDPDVVFASTFVLLLGGRAETFLALVAVLEQAEPAGRAAIRRALELVPVTGLGARLASLAAATPTLRRELLEVLGHLGTDPALPLDPLLASDDPDQQALGISLASRFPHRLGPGHLDRALRSSEPLVRAAAFQTGLILREPKVLEAAQATFAERDAGFEAAALILGVSEGRQAIEALIAALRDPARAPQAAFGLGFSGQVTAADALIEAMADPDLAPLAGEAFSAITGVAVEKSLARPPKRWDPTRDTDDQDDEVEGPEADLPVPDQEAVSKWWSLARPRLDPSQRWLRGRTWSLEHLLGELEVGPARRRQVLALELAARTGGRAQLAWDALSSRQWAELRAFRGSLSRALTPAIGAAGNHVHGSFTAPSARPTPVPSAGLATPAGVPGARAPLHQPLAVTGIGMVSSLGDGAVASCAAARAGVTRPRGLEGWTVLDPEEGEGMPAVGHAVAGLEGFTGLGRFLCLGAAGLKDLLADAPQEPGVRTGLFLALPSGWVLDGADRVSAMGLPSEDEGEEEGEAPKPEEEASEPGGPPELVRAEQQRTLLQQNLPLKLLDLAGVHVPFQQIRLFFSDSPGFVEALGAAHEALAARQLDRCVVGGIDTLLDAECLEALAIVDLLKAPQTPTGLAPGEAAAFVQVELPDQARRRKARVLCHVDAWSAASEPQDALSAKAFLGRALADAVGATLERAPGVTEGLRLVIADQNGTDARAQDWGNTLVRLQKRHFPEVAQWYPALHFGQIGAATGPVGVCMGARAFARGYAPSADVLLWLWSETGARAALLVRSA